MNFPIIFSAFLIGMEPTSVAVNPSANEVLTTKELPRVEYNAFKKGERLKYAVSYGWLDAGEAVIEIKNEERMIAGRPILHMVGTGKSLGTFNFFFEVKDRYESYVDQQGLFPWIFVRDINEGGFKLKQYYTFDQYKQKVKTDKGKEYSVPLGIQDMISSFYRARALDFKGVKPGQVFQMEAFVDGEIWPMKIRYIKNEVVETDKGKFDCMVFRPVVQTGRIFKKEEDMTVWITRDKNRVPVLAKAKILVGSITMELIDYQGLANPIAKL